MIEPLRSGTYGAIKRKIAELIRFVNGQAEVTIRRGGPDAQDYVSRGSNGNMVIHLRGFPASTETAETSGDPGLFIYLGDDEGYFIPNSQVMDGYDPGEDENWSLQVEVEDGRIADLDANPPFGTSAMDDGAGTEGTERYDGDASTVDGVSGDPDPTPQTYYRIPVIRKKTLTIDGDPVDRKLRWDINGIYRENIKCAGNRGRIAELLKIG
jgi:hypothetical protein